MFQNHNCSDKTNKIVITVSNRAENNLVRTRKYIKKDFLIKYFRK
jgi:hypothetical protein